MKMLLTGSRGMLGSSILETINENFEVLAPARDEMDLLNAKEVFDYLSTFKPNYIIHAAARVGGIQANIDNGFEFLTENLQMDSNLFSAALKLKINNLVYIGSTCMYPKDREIALKESDLLTGSLEPTNEGYALAKIIGTKTVELASQREGLFWRTLILSNLYGPKDHFEPERSHLIAAVIRKVDVALQKNESSVVMWGDGTSRREFTFVRDVADFITSHLEDLSALPVTMNLGSGVDYSIQDFYEFIAKEMNYRGKIVSDLSKPNGMKRKLSDSSLATAHGWVSKTGIHAGLSETVAWYNESKVRYSP